MSPLISVPLLFREFHNLKSALSMEGVDLAAELIHAAESCLDALRSGKGDPDSDWVDALMAVVDHVRKIVATGHDSASPGLSARLASLLDGWLSRGKNQDRRIGFPLDRMEAQALRAALSSKLTPYVLEKVVGDDLDAGSVDTLPVFESIAEAGSLIARRILRAKGSGSVLTILFATDKSAEDLSYLLFDPFYPVCGFCEASVAPAAPAAPDKLERILIVEDEPVALMLLQRFLSQYGRLDTAGDGLEAIEKVAKALASKDPYRVVFLDIMIPGTLGSAVLEEIRKLEAMAGTIAGEGSRIVMASSISDYTSISTSFKNQGDAYLVKPIDAPTIDKTMAKFGFSKMALPFTAVPRSGQRQQ